MPEHQTEAAAVAELSEQTPTIMEPPEEGDLIVVHRNDFDVREINRERFEPTPRRKQAQRIIHRFSSFLDFVDEQMTKSTTRGYIDDRKILVCFDDDEALAEGVPGWRSNTVRFEPKYREDFEAWLNLNQAWLSQKNFAEFLEVRGHVIEEPSSADMRELASTVSATVSASFRSGVKLQDGTRQLLWAESVDAGGGESGQMEIPEELLLALIPVTGSEPFAVKAKLYYRINEGELSFSYRLVDIEDLFDAIFDDFARELIETGIPLVFGEFPGPAQTSNSF